MWPFCFLVVEAEELIQKSRKDWKKALFAKPTPCENFLGVGLCIDLLAFEKGVFS